MVKGLGLRALRIRIGSSGAPLTGSTRATICVQGLGGGSGPMTMFIVYYPEGCTGVLIRVRLSEVLEKN